jgi:hypothetical protein
MGDQHSHICAPKDWTRNFPSTKITAQILANTLETVSYKLFNFLNNVRNVGGLVLFRSCYSWKEQWHTAKPTVRNQSQLSRLLGYAPDIVT